MQIKKQLILIGGGGHCKVIIDAIQAARHYRIMGIIDKNTSASEILGIPVIGDDSQLEDIFSRRCQLAFVAIGSVGHPQKRAELADKLQSIGFQIPAIAHPTAVIARDIALGKGTFVSAGAVIGPGTIIGNNVIVNTNASVDHDCYLDDYVHVAPGATLSGGVKVAAYSHIGTGASIIEYKNIGSNTLIGAGSVVVDDIPSNCKAFGNPCHVVNSF